MWLRVCGLGFRTWSHADLGGVGLVEVVLVWPVLRVFSAGLQYGSLLHTPGLVEVVLVWPVECPGAGVRV